MRTFKHAVALISLHLLSLALCFGQNQGDKVRLEVGNPKGVPVHPAAADNSYVRWASGTIGTVVAVDPQSGWLKIDSHGQIGWVTKNYLVVIPAEDVDENPPDEILSYVVGTWNLEWFKDGKSRGFPESGYGGPSYGSRTDADIGLIAGLIKTQIFATILVLNEINGTTGSKSVEVERLIRFLGTNWSYDIGASGGSQRIALVYDRNCVRKDGLKEIDMPDISVGGSSLFARHPLVGKFTFLDRQGSPQNDIVVVAVHLASGQDKVENHNKAMARLRNEIHLCCDNGEFAGERDILILGDFNASRYDNKIEDFWENYDSGGFRFRTLSPENGEEYPGTRLAGVPLSLRSQIDYIFASGLNGGLLEKLVQITALVHTGLVPVPNSFDPYREHVSDHLPVTVRIRVVPDTD